jgi:hypothetical protein
VERTVRKCESLNVRIGMDEYIGMELLKSGFDYVCYGGDLNVTVDCMV